MAVASSREEGLLYYLAAAGALIGIGKLLISNEPMTTRKAIGHGIVSGGLGGCAGLLLIPLPNVPLEVLLAAACALASLGASTITMIVQRYLEKK